MRFLIISKEKLQLWFRKKFSMEGLIVSEIVPVRSQGLFRKKSTVTRKGVYNAIGKNRFEIIVLFFNIANNASLDKPDIYV